MEDPLKELGLVLPIIHEIHETHEVKKKEEEEDYYLRYSELMKQIEFTQLQEDYIKDETKQLKKEMQKAKEELKRLQSTPLVIGSILEVLSENEAIVESPHGPKLVGILSTLNPEKLKIGSTVALHRGSSSVVDILESDVDPHISKMKMAEKPDVTWADIGGLDTQKQEIKEAVEIPLLYPEIFKQIGIDPPRGCLLYGPPGTGKTMMAKAVANTTKASFFSLAASELVSKWLGDGPKNVRDLFKLAKECAPSIIFFDEIDAVATKRSDSGGGADREVQRILIELLAQMDGFDQTEKVCVIMCTNRPDTLDPALMRPGRIDRQIHFPPPDRRQKRQLFQVCTAKMNLSEDVNLEDYISRTDKLSAAEINAICQEAGLLAVRGNRYVIMEKDFSKAYSNAIKSTTKTELLEFYN